jgi:hypothetical protein
MSSASLSLSRPHGATRRPLLLLTVCFVTLAAALTALAQLTDPRYGLSHAAAIAAARANPVVRAFVRGHPGVTARVVPLDQTTQAVGLFHGPRIVLEAAVSSLGRVVSTEGFAPGHAQIGAALANRAGVLGGLTVIFLLATMVWPLRRWRNLDALVLASVVGIVVAVNARLVAWEVLASTLLLLYLIVRCAVVALRPRPPTPATPLLVRALGDRPADRSRRLVRLSLAALLLCILMITLSSSGYIDVAVASLQGATELLHGTLPYGHITLAFHGDTYPLLTYVAYIPGALLLPVTDVFSNFDGALYVTAAAVALAALATWRLAGRVPGAGELLVRERAVLAWLAFPPVLLAASAGTNDLVLAAIVAWVLLVAARRRLAVLGLALAAWVKVVPIVLLPLWLARGGRGARRRALVPAVALSLALSGALVALGGPGALGAMLGALRFQFERGSFHAPWFLFGLRWLQPLAQAATLCLLVAGVLALRTDRALREDGTRVAALAAAVLLGVQLSANDWSITYLTWAYPLIAVALLFGGPAAERPPATATLR